MKIVSVTWVDTTKKMNEDSFDEDKNIDELTTPMKTVGWLYKQTNKTILLVQEFEGGLPRDWVVIPKGIITEKEEFGE